MSKKQLETLTKSMYYTLIVLLQARCGMKTTELVLRLTGGRVHLVPGTLYTMLSKSENGDMVRGTESDGRKRFYLIIEKGKGMLMQGYRRLRAMLQDGEVRIEKQSDEKGAASRNEGRDMYG